MESGRGTVEVKENYRFVGQKGRGLFKIRTLEVQK
jgi:hypothetical protein